MPALCREIAATAPMAATTTQHRQHAPEGEFAPHAAAINDLVRIERPE